MDPATRALKCACQACAILFGHRESKTKYLRVPRDTRSLLDFSLDDAEWAALMLPIDIAFFLRSSAQERVVAFYPSPAGATESLLSLDAWNDLVERNPVLNTMLPDVEALLVNRLGENRQYFIAPIDKCYQLVGLIRTYWRGLSGGDVVWTEIDQFLSMPELNFSVEAAEAVPYAVSPMLGLKLRISSDEAVQSIALRCQIQIEPTRRAYASDEKGKLLDLFGEPDHWGRSLRTMLWTHVNLNVAPFTTSTLVDLPVPCTFDFNVASAKYFNALADGEVPLNLLFSGTLFYQTNDGALQVAQIPWSKECRYRLPVRVWKEMMDIYYPNSAWLCLRRDSFNRLNEYKMSKGMATWEQALESLLA